MATYPCAKCGAVGPQAVREAVRNANPSAGRCPSCDGAVDGNGKTLEPQPVVGASAS